MFHFVNMNMKKKKNYSCCCHKFCTENQARLKAVSLASGFFYLPASQISHRTYNAPQMLRVPFWRIVSYDVNPESVSACRTFEDELSELQVNARLGRRARS